LKIAVFFDPEGVKKKKGTRKFMRNEYMSELSPQNQQDTFQMIWAKRLFVLSLVLFGIIFALQGVGILEFPAAPAKAQHVPAKPIRVGGLLCQEPVWDFGLIDSIKNSRLSHEFTLVNESKETVTIQKINSTCGCMVAEGYDKELFPGKSTKVKVIVQLPPTPQLFHKSLEIHINKGVVTLDVVGEIAANKNLYSLPEKIDFGIIQPGETKERIVQVFRHDLSDILHDSISVNIEGESIFGKCKVVDFVDRYKLIINIQISTLGECLHPSYVDGRIVIKTKNPYSELIIPVCVRISGSSDSEYYLIKN
jgi:hypothetical protein